MLEAGRLVGLRPKEWRSAWIEDDVRGHKKLIVRNGKASNGRAHGIWRTLHLHEIQEEELAIVTSMLDTARAQGDQWPVFYKACRKLLGRVTKRLWPTRQARPSLYSGRHQFAADAKAAEFTLIEIAAMMGHGADRTASEHYGRRRHGRTSGFRVRADSADVAKVRATARPGPQQRGASLDQ